jgi:hypothetical protein
MPPPEPGKQKIFLRTRKLMSVPHVTSSVTSGSAVAIERMRSSPVSSCFAVHGLAMVQF